MTWIRAVGATDVGSSRTVNEDAWGFVEDSDAALAIVADGMGGNASGRPAADLALTIGTAVFERRVADYAEAWWRAEHDPPPIAWADLAAADRAVIEARVREIRSTRAAATPGDLAILESDRDIIAVVARRCLAEASRVVAQRAQDDITLRGMGATAVVAVFERGVVAIAHVGDSRCYRWRDGSLHQLTDDHTLLRALLDSGELAPEEVESFPHKQVITRALGYGEVEVDTRVVETLPGDMFLLCTDGISNTLDEAMLRDVLEDHRAAAAEHLVERARHTSRDNVTALVVEVTS